jgi:hypothetical protein
MEMENTKGPGGNQTYRFEQEIIGGDVLELHKWFDSKDPFPSKTPHPSPATQNLEINPPKATLNKSSNLNKTSNGTLSSYTGTVDHDLHECEIELRRLNEKTQLYLKRIQTLKKKREKKETPHPLSANLRPTPKNPNQPTPTGARAPPGSLDGGESRYGPGQVSRNETSSVENSSRAILNEELKRAQDLAEASQQNLENALARFRNAGRNFGTDENSVRDFSLQIFGGNGGSVHGGSVGDLQETGNVGYESVKREVKNLIGLTQSFGEVLVEVTKNQGIIKKAFLRRVESPGKDDPLEQELT